MINADICNALLQRESYCRQAMVKTEDFCKKISIEYL